jgi:N-acetylmuramoyl-L-alanine amidase
MKGRVTPAMMPAVGFGLLVTSWLAVAAQAISSQTAATPRALSARERAGQRADIERVTLWGTEYARVEDWAAANRFKVEWITRNRQLRVIASGTPLVFEADARTVVVNGIAVHLSAPVAMKNGGAYVPPMDLTATLQPLLAPTRQSKPLTTICLDPGHGGKDPGHLAGKEQEKKYTMLFAREVGEQLSKAGFKVSYTRSSDTFIDLPTRSDIAQKRNADLFVSLHFNSADGPGAEAVKGVEVYCMTLAHTSSTNARGEGSMGACAGNRFDAKNVLLAYQLQKSLVNKVGLEDRGVRRARYAVLRNADMPAVLIESGFLSNPTESKRIYDAKYRRQLAQAIVQGVQEYKRVISNQ